MMKLNKILIVTTFNYPHQGGLSSHIDLLRKGYTYHGVENDVLSLSNLSVWIKYLKMFLVGPVYLVNKGLAMYYLHSITCFYLKRKINKVAGDYDAVHFHEASLLLNNPIPCRKILTVHADYTNMAIGEKAFTAESAAAAKFLVIERLSYQNADKILAVDERLKQHVVSLSGRQDVHKQINFVDTDEYNYAANFDLAAFKKEYQISEDFKIIICPRRLVIKNGVIYAAKLLKLLPENFMLIFIGDGPQLSSIQDYAHENAIGDRIKYFKSITRENMKFFYWIADYIIIPSVTVADGMQEATSIAAIEGMASSKIVLASAIGGLKELISSYNNGILFPEKDMVCVANCITKLEQDTVVSAKIKQQAKQSVVSNFDYKKSVKNIVNYIAN